MVQRLAEEKYSIARSLSNVKLCALQPMIIKSLLDKNLMAMINADDPSYFVIWGITFSMRRDLDLSQKDVITSMRIQ